MTCAALLICMDILHVMISACFQSTDELIINVWKGGDYEWQYTMENVVRHGYKAILSAPWYLNYISYGRDWTKYYEQDPHTFLMYSQGTYSFSSSGVSR